MSDGVLIFEALSSMDNSSFKAYEISYDEDDNYQAYKNYELTMR